MQPFAFARQRHLPESTGRIFGLVHREMALVEREFERQVGSNIQVIDYLGDYIRSSGGKRVRPALLVLANQAAGGDGSSESVIRMAAVMEMLHTATLVHDDIIDNAELRRRRPSVNARFGNQAAVLMGDWLYMSAFETSLRERSLEILDIITELTRKMTEGELIQLTVIGNVDLDEETHMEILRRKTAYLFAACCEVGAVLAGADAATKRALRGFGLELGIAFQLSDDLLDLTGDSRSLGKAVGSDLLEGKITLPLILLLNARPDLREPILGIMRDGEYETLSRDELRTRLRELGIFAEVQARARGHADSAKKSLEVLPQTEYRSSLEDVLAFVVEREV